MSKKTNTIAWCRLNLYPPYSDMAQFSTVKYMVNEPFHYIFITPIILAISARARCHMNSGVLCVQFGRRIDNSRYIFRR